MGPKEQATIEGGYFPSSEFADYAGEEEAAAEAYRLTDIAEDRQQTYAEERRQYRIANNLPREREALRNGIEEKDQ